MGWNEGYRIMESQVVELYNLGVLNKDVLNVLMEPFKNSDLDSGGSESLKTQDGKSAEDVICYIMEPERYQEAVDDFVPDPEEPDYNEALYDLCSEIKSEKWNIW